MNTELRPHAPLTGYYHDEAERRRVVSEFFDEAAPSYEWIIGFMSFGSGDWYRHRTLERAGLTAGMKVLDVACGTGAISRQAVRLAGPTGQVIGVDPSTGMLRENYNRHVLGASASSSTSAPGVAGTGRGDKASLILVQGFAEQLPFRDASFDFLSMGYALRHVSDLGMTFAEYFRVLRPGGRLAILEFARPKGRIAFGSTWFFLDKIVPLASRLYSRKPKAGELMRYCWDTVDQSIPQASILAAIEGAGFREARSEQQYGILGNYTAVKPGV